MINKYFTRFLLLIGFFFFWSSYKGYSTSTDGAEDTSELSPIELIDPAHEENLATAFNLANEYYYGKGREINKELAIQWYKKASELGLSDADEKLGIIYYNGFGVPIDYDLAFKYSLRAAEYGKPSAQNIVGICYKNGSGTKKKGSFLD